jgi:hypothetical protein
MFFASEFFMVNSISGLHMCHVVKNWSCREWKSNFGTCFYCCSDNPKWSAAAACVRGPNRPAKRPVGVPAGRLVSLGRQRQGQAQAGHDAQGRVLRPAAQGTRATLPAAKVHQQTRQEEAGREAWTQRLAGQFPPFEILVTSPIVFFMDAQQNSELIPYKN